MNSKFNAELDLKSNPNPNSNIKEVNCNYVWIYWILATLTTSIIDILCHLHIHSKVSGVMVLISLYHSSMIARKSFLWGSIPQTFQSSENFLKMAIKIYWKWYELVDPS